MKYNISYERNEVYQAILVEAPSADVAKRFFVSQTPDAKILGVKEATRDDEKPGKPVITAPETKYIVPEVGQIFTLRGGGEYRCLSVTDIDRVAQGECSAVMIRDKDGWELTVHGLQQSENGTVEWDYSTGGHWAKNSFEVWKDSELGPTYMEKKFATKEEAEEWISSHEKSYPGWHLRIEGKYIEPKPSLTDRLAAAEQRVGTVQHDTPVKENEL